MTYKKPCAEVVRFDDNCVFMTASVDYSSAGAVLSSVCGGFSGDTNNFTCSLFGGYSETNPPSQNAQVTFGDGEHTYIYDHKGNHWKQHKGN